jgi:hydrogenase-4 component B
MNLVPLDVSNGTERALSIVTGDSVLAPLMLGFVMLAILAGLYIVRRLLTNAQFERQHRTWDGGQALSPRMEYTSTGFSAPIRYFFRFISRSQKLVTATPVISSNPWIASRSMVIEDRRSWYERFYQPVGRAFNRAAMVASWIQNGSIQFYVTLILLSLFVTLIIAL